MAAKKSAGKSPTNKAKPVRNKARKVAVAEAIVQGTPITHIASDLGVSRATVNRDAASPEVRQILTLLISDKLVLLESVLKKVLAAIEDALSANVLTPTKEGTVVTVGPDHYARLAACKRFIEITTAGRPLPKAPEPHDDKRTITLAEFQELVKQYQLASNSSSQAGPN